MKNVLMCTEANNYASRCIFTGVQKFVESKGDWNTHMVSFPDVLTAEMVERAPAEGFDGILFPFITEPGVVDALVKSPLPIVTQGHRLIPRRKKAIAVVDICDRDVGAMGARHFLGLGKFNSYAFAPHTDSPYWSEKRARGFVEELKQHGIRATVLADGGSQREIAALPKPAAIMAAWDYKAIEIMGYARKAGLAIPEQIAVIGVDADPIVCSFTNPPLTSVEPGFERMGYAGAAALDAMMCGRKLNSVIRIPCLPKGMIERASTSFLPTGRALVDRATTIIVQEAANGLSVGALSARLKVSPQLLALRFHQFKQATPRELILRTRLEKAKKLLRDPTMKTESVASQCGFSSKNRLFHVFKERFGITIGDFRRSCHLA